MPRRTEPVSTLPSSGHHSRYFGSRPWLKPTDLGLGMKVADGLTQQGRHPRSTALGEESARPDPPAARARHLSLGSTELWPPAAATMPAAHLLCAPCAPARPRVTEVLQHQPLGSSQPPASKSQGRMWQLREVKGLAQSHTAGGAGAPAPPGLSDHRQAPCPGPRSWHTRALGPECGGCTCRTPSSRARCSCWLGSSLGRARETGCS